MSETDPLVLTSRGGVLTPEALDILLSQIMTTRLQRKAKGIITSCVELLITDLSIIYTTLNYEIPNGGIKIGMTVMIVLAALYSLLMAIFLFVHSECYAPKNTKPIMEVEAAFARTNSNPPPIDGILELLFPAKFKGNVWYLPYIGWGIAVSIALSCALMFLAVQDQVSGTTVAGLSTGGILLYQITSDFSEYWVLSRNHNQIAIEVGVEGNGEAALPLLS
jgi:hypothetical protein